MINEFITTVYYLLSTTYFFKIMLNLLKLSGKAIDEFLTNPIWMAVVKKLSSDGNQLVIVHGAGKEITNWCALFGIQSTFVDGQRVTDDETMMVVSAVQSGWINGKLVAKLNHEKIESVGLTGSDRSLVIGEMNNTKLGRVGVPVVSENSGWVKDLVMSGVVPVFSSACLGVDGKMVNVNADWFAGALAAALKADAIFFISDIPGVLIEGKVQQVLTPESIQNGIISGDITDGMIPKLKSCEQLLGQGVGKVWIGPGNPDAILNLLAGTPAGTWIVENENV